MNVSAWEAIFMLVVLKIPLIYLGVVVWWAVRAVPEPAGGGDEVGVVAPLSPPCGWNAWQRRRSVLSSGRPLRPTGMRAAARVGVR